jgi:hypothetical protein
MRRWFFAAALVAALGVPAAALAAAPVVGFIAGKVTSAKGGKLVVQGQSGVSGVTLSKSTVVVENEPGSSRDLAKGACVVANGQRAKDGSVAAATVTVSAAGKNGCDAGFGGRGGPRPNGRRPNGQRPPRPAGQQGRQFPANFGFAAGSISSVKGSKLQVKGQRGTTTVVVSSSTRILKTARVDGGAVKTGSCVFVRGTSTDNGLTVSAQNVTVSPAGPNGCLAGFRGRGGQRPGGGGGNA